MEDKNAIGNIKPIEAGNSFGIKSENSPFAESFYFEDFYDDKLISKFIKNVEKLIRTSYEYKAYITDLREEVIQLNRDSVLGNITTSDVDMEFHHYPFSLYEIVEILMIDKIAKKEGFTSFSLAKEIMELHNKHVIGLVPLTKTVHELAHLGSIFLSKKQIFGDYSAFMTTYSASISYDLKSKIQEMEDFSSKNIPADYRGILWVTHQ